MLQLEAIHYRPIHVLPEEIRQGGADTARVLGDLIGQDIAETTQRFGDTPMAYSMAVSTIMDMPFTSGFVTWPDIARDIARHTPHVPSNFTASYECAGWGFALDYAARRCPEGGRVLLVVADLNMLDISFWRGNENWGHSGFGISTVVLNLPPVHERRLRTRVAKSAQGMGEFCADLRKWLAQSPAELANVPFLPKEMSGIYDHFLPSERVMPDLHAQWGHCFGSDTWISFIDAYERGLLNAHTPYCATSASLRGYWTLADCTVSPDATIGFRGLDAFHQQRASA